MSLIDDLKAAHAASLIDDLRAIKVVGFNYVPLNHVFECLECWCEWQWANSQQYRESGGPTAYDLAVRDEPD